MTKPTEPHWDENRAREDLNATFDFADLEPRRRGIPWARAWEARPAELDVSIDHALDAVDDAWERRDPAAHSAALEEFRRVVTTILDAYQRATREGDRVPA